MWFDDTEVFWNKMYLNLKFSVSMSVYHINAKKLQERKSDILCMSSYIGIQLYHNTGLK